MRCGDSISAHAPRSTRNENRVWNGTNKFCGNERKRGEEEKYGYNSLATSTGNGENTANTSA